MASNKIKCFDCEIEVTKKHYERLFRFKRHHNTQNQNIKFKD